MILPMNKLFRFHESKDFKFPLAFCWSLFLSLGFLLGNFAKEQVGLYIPSFVISRASVWCSLFIHSVFIIATWIFLRYDKRFILFFSALRGFGFGFLNGVVLGCFGSAGWLVSFLLNFSGMICTVVEIFVWSLNFETFDRRKILFYFVIPYVIVLLAIWLDYVFFSFILKEVIFYY